VATDKGTRVDVEEAFFKKVFAICACVNGSSVQHDKKCTCNNLFFKCTAASNVEANVCAAEGTVVGLMACTVADSLENCGLVAKDKGTLVDAEETTFQRNCLNVVAAFEYASVQLATRKAARNKNANGVAHKGGAVGLTGSTVAESLENCGLVAKDNGTRVDAKETTFQGNCLNGAAVFEYASVQLDNCSVTRNCTLARTQ
jgi:hypothetical protein